MQAHTSNLLPFHWAVSLNMQAWLSDSIFTAWSNKYHPEWLFFLILGCLSSTSVRGIEWATVVAKSAEWFFEVPVLTREWYWAFVGFTQSTAKECSNYCTIALISRASKVSLKILQARFLQYVNRELPDVQARFRKGRGTIDQIANICWIIKKAREFQKTSTSASLTMPKPLTVWFTTNCGKFWKGWEYQTTWPASWEICVKVRKQQLELDKEQWTVSQLEKE